MELPAVELDPEPERRVGEIELERSLPGPHAMLLDGRREATGNEQPKHSGLEVAVASVVSRQPFGQELVEGRQPAARRLAQPGDTPTKRSEAHHPPPKTGVDGRPQGSVGQAGREVDQCPGRCGERDAVAGGQFGTEEGAGTVTLDTL